MRNQIKQPSYAEASCGTQLHHSPESMTSLTGSRGGHRQPCRASLSSAFVTSPLKGVTGLTSWPSHGPDGSRGGRERAKGTEWYLFFGSCGSFTFIYDRVSSRNGSRPEDTGSGVHLAALAEGVQT